MATTTKKSATTKSSSATTKTTIAKAGKKLTPKEILSMLKAKYDEAFDDGGVYCIKEKNKWGFADANGAVKIKPCFSAIGEEWVEDIIVTYGASGIGFVNKKLEEIAKPQFGASGNFRKGIAPVKAKSNKWGIIDKKGKIVVPLVFDEIAIGSGGKIVAKIGSYEFVTK
jgi:hypothetical protein